MTLRPYQLELKSAIYNSWNAGNKNVLAVSPTGSGKCLGRDTPVLMFDGKIKNVQDVVAGDLLMGPDSSPRLVVSVTKGLDFLYKVLPVKGDSYVVNSEHILSLKKTGEKKNDRNKGQIVNISIKDYLKSTDYFKHVHKGWRTSVDFKSEMVDFDPYMLGLWLGDGSSASPQITTPDIEIISYCYDFAEKNNLKISVAKNYKNSKAGSLSFSGNKAFFKKFLRKHDLIKNKHIPHVYKTSSRENRLKLLAGIIDTDGHYGSDGSVDIIFKQEKLLDDLIFLVRSLGFSAYKSPQRKTCTNTGASDIYYRCSINGDLEQIPLMVQRKKANSRKQIKNVLVTGIDVQPQGFGEYFGFELYGNDRLFLLGDFTVTHNTMLFADIVLDHYNARQKCAVIAHRNELVTQMSTTIAAQGVQHRIVGSDSAIAQTVRKHREKFGKSFISPSAPTAVIGVDTLMARSDDLKDWAQQIDLWIIDESHHVLGNDRVNPNKWGKAVQLFRNAKGLGVTATPSRADGQGLGWKYDGVFHDMIVGPRPRWLIEQGFLADYEIVCPESDLKIDDSEVGKDGDWSNQKLRKAAKTSHIVGDTVQNYVKYALGRKAIVFATDIETADEIAKSFNDAGIRSVSLNGKSEARYREQSLKGFERGEITILVNVDLFDEGFDCPSADICIMARPTASLGKYLQMIGRILRPMPDKIALIIDQVSNVVRHGLPDKHREWTLARRDKRAKQQKDPEEIELRVCHSCKHPYEAFRTVCPHCGVEKPLPEPRSRTIEMVDGDLILLDRETLARMRAATQLESAADVAGRVGGVAGSFAARGVANRQMEKIAAHQELQEVIAQWAGIERHKGYSDSEIMRKFYLTTGTDVLGALDGSKSRQEFETLRDRVKGWYEF